MSVRGDRGFDQTGNPNSPKFRFPQTEEDLREMEAILQKKLDRSGKAA